MLLPYRPSFDGANCHDAHVLQNAVESKVFILKESFMFFLDVSSKQTC